jgi:hypothetical protein
MPSLAAPIYSGVSPMPNPCQIVVVEDVFVRNFLRAALERLGYTVICATVAEAKRFLQSDKADLLVTNTPGEFGEFGASIPLLYIAAFPDPAHATSFRQWLPLRKPFQSVELTAALERLLATR